jgi:hypothetical protein
MLNSWQNYRIYSHYIDSIGLVKNIEYIDSGTANRRE